MDGHSGHKSDPSVAVLTPAAKGLTPCTSQQKLDTNFKFFYSKDWFFVQCYGCLDTSLFGFRAVPGRHGSGSYRQPQWSQ